MCSVSLGPRAAAAGAHAQDPQARACEREMEAAAAFRCAQHDADLVARNPGAFQNLSRIAALLAFIRVAHPRDAGLKLDLASHR